MREFFTEPVVTGLIFFLVVTVPFWNVMWWLYRRDRRRAAESKPSLGTAGSALGNGTADLGRTALG